MSTDVLGAPSAKEKKYDRQLRLWAANGQQALEEAHICLVNATAAGVEILKNLILPSIGQYTIIDNSKVTEADLGVNFFLEESSIGQDRAKATCELLQELNPDVKGNYIVEDFESLLSNPDRLRPFTVFIVTGDIPSDTLLRLDSLLYPLNIPFFIVKSIGFTMSCRVVLKEHTIVESHPDDTIDLRLLSPFPSLVDLYKRKTEHLCANDKSLMSDHEFGHVPYVLILLKYLDNWAESHNGKYPETYKEKNEFKASIRAGMRTPDDENFEEAISAVLKNLNKPSIPSNTKQIFDDEKCITPVITNTPKTDNFWIIARAVKDFTYNQNNGLLPLPGALPDMKAESAGYIELQNIYKTKARADADEVYSNVNTLLKSLGKEEGSISKDDVDTWCKHAAYVKLIRGRSLADEYNNNNNQGSGSGSSGSSKAIANNIGDASSLIHFHLALRAYEDFTTKHKRSPGEGDDTSLDTEAMMETVRSIVKSSIPPSSSDEEVFIGEAEEAAEKAVGELVRAGGGEMHNISSFAGGVVAQEVIKAVTRQYVLMDNTVVFDGISSRSEVFVL